MITQRNIQLFQAEEAALQVSNAEKNQRKEIDEMLTSLGVAPISGMNLIFLQCLHKAKFVQGKTNNADTCPM